MIGLSILISWITGLAASPIGPQLGEGETGKSGTPPPTIEVRTIEVSGGWIWQVFSTLPRQNCHVTHPLPPSCAIAPLFSRSWTNYLKCSCVTYINITS